MVIKPSEGTAPRFKLLDSQEDRIECGAVILNGSDCDCHYKAYGLHDCPTCGSEQSLAHGAECESCAQRRLFAE